MKTAVADCPAKITIDVDGRPENLIRAGASLRGAVYRGQSSGGYFRLIPIRLVPVEWRYEIQQALQSSLPAVVVKPDRAWQPVDLPGYFCVRYPLIGELTLAEQTGPDGAVERLRKTAAVLRAAEAWLRSPDRTLVPLAADMLVSAGSVRLLWLPIGPPPTVDCVFCEPAVALHLAPEVVRSSSSGNWQQPDFVQAVNRYALGSLALAAFYELPQQQDPDRLLFRAAAAIALKDLPKRRDLPSWLDQFAAGKQALAVARRLASSKPESRLKDSLQTLADLLDQCADLCNPRTAAQKLCDFGHPVEALALLQGVFPVAESYHLSPEDMYSLLVRAGDIAGQFLSRPLEAIDFYDRAIEKSPEREEAHESQLKLITAAADPPILELILRNDSASVQLDVRAWRGFRGVSPEIQASYVHPLARYLNLRRQFSKAITFIWERLFDADGSYRWWDFDLNLEYVRALMGVDQLAQAGEQLQKVKQGLNYMQVNQTLAEDAVDYYGIQCAELERLLHELRNVTRSENDG